MFTASKYSNIDHRQIDLRDGPTRTYFEDFCTHLIDESMNYRKASLIEEVWKRNLLYIDGYQVPVGFSNDYLQAFVQANWDKLDATSVLKKDEDGLIYVVDNKIPDMRDAVIGEYTSVNKTTQVIKDDSARNNSIEKAIQVLFDRFERKKQMWTNIVVPCIEDMIDFGIGWSKERYNPYRALPIGDIDMQVVDPRWVYVDPVNTQGKYFSDTKYLVHHNPMQIDEANQLFKLSGYDGREVYPDSSFNASLFIDNQTALNLQTDYTDVYFIEYCKEYPVPYKKKLDLKSMNSSVDVGNAKVEMKMFYFYMIYNKQTGLIHHEINQNTYSHDEYFKYYLTPWYNKRSKTRLYPISDIEMLANLQDLINITKTLVLDNARKRNVLRAFIKGSLSDTYSDSQIDKWMREGGLLAIDDEMIGSDGDMRKSIIPMDLQSTPKEIYDIMTLAEQSFERQSDSESPLRGDYPQAGETPSGKAIGLLQSQKRRKISYKDINISWAATQRAKKMYNIFAFNFDEEMYIRLTDAKKGDPGLSIINGMRSFAEYEDLLIEAGLIDESNAQILKILNPQDPNYFAMKMAIIQPATKKFEESNEVEFIFSAIGTYGQKLSGEQMYLNGVVFINMLSKDDNVDIKIDLDFDSERDKQEEKAVGGMLYQRGDLVFEMYLELLGGWFVDNKEEIISKKEKQDMIMMLANQISARGPEFQQAVGGLMNQYDLSNMQKLSGNNKGGKPENPNNKNNQQKQVPQQTGNTFQKQNNQQL